MADLLISGFVLLFCACVFIFAELAYRDWRRERMARNDAIGAATRIIKKMNDENN